MRCLGQLIQLKTLAVAVALLSANHSLAGVRVLDIEATYQGDTTLSRWQPGRTPERTVNREDFLGSTGTRRPSGAGVTLETSWLNFSGVGRESDVSNTARIRHTNSVAASNRSSSSLVFGQVLTETSLRLDIREPVVLEVSTAWTGSGLAGTGRIEQNGALSVLGILNTGILFESVEFEGTGSETVLWRFEIGSPTTLTFDFEIGAFVEPGVDPSDLTSFAELDVAFIARPIPAPGAAAPLIAGLLVSRRRRRADRR